MIHIRTWSRSKISIQENEVEPIVSFKAYDPSWAFKKKDQPYHVTTQIPLQLPIDMGRTKPKKKVYSKATDPPPDSKKAPSTTSLLAKAQSLIDQCDYDLALRFISRILDQDPKNAEAKEMLGVALLETGEIEGAKQVRYQNFGPSFILMIL